MCLLKRFLPFAFALIVGTIVGGVIWRHKSNASYERLMREIKAGNVYKIELVDSKAVILSKPAPSYTKEARKNGTSGVVRMRVLLNALGNVTDIQMLSALPDGLTESAIEAAKQIEFDPAMKDGHPVSQWITIEYNFNLY